MLDAFVRRYDMHGGEFASVDAYDKLAETLIVENVVAPRVGVEGEGCDGLEAGDVAFLENVGDAFVSLLVHEIEDAGLLWCVAGSAYLGERVDGYDCKAVEAVVPFERYLCVIRKGDGWIVVEGGEDAVFM